MLYTYYATGYVECVRATVAKQNHVFHVFTHYNHTSQCIRLKLRSVHFGNGKFEMNSFYQQNVIGRGFQYQMFERLMGDVEIF